MRFAAAELVADKTHDARDTLGMTYPISNYAAERCTQRAKHRSLRALARSSVKNALVEVIDELRREEPPDWFTQDQDIAWKEELANQRRRILGRHNIKL